MKAKLNRAQEVAHISREIQLGRSEYKGVKLPKPQTCGTITQRISYANMVAVGVYNRIYGTNDLNQIL